MVIGGGFHEEMRTNKCISSIAKKLDGIIVETNTMVNKLHEQCFDNIYHLNNFKKLDIVKKKDINFEYTLPLPICTFSRVLKEKGIEDIINAVKKLNQQENKVVYSLDIYGQIDEKYKKEFEKKMKYFPEYIRYKGVVEYDKSVQTIKNYYLLAFPTLYRTEGVPGTIIDAYASGVPVVASNWDSYQDVIDNNKTGIIFNMGDVDDLIEKLRQLYLNPEIVIKMKYNCIEKALEYSTDFVIDKLIEILNKR